MEIINKTVITKDMIYYAGKIKTDNDKLLKRVRYTALFLYIIFGLIIVNSLINEIKKSTVIFLSVYIGIIIYLYYVYMAYIKRLCNRYVSNNEVLTGKKFEYIINDSKIVIKYKSGKKKETQEFMWNIMSDYSINKDIYYLTIRNGTYIIDGQKFNEEEKEYMKKLLKDNNKDYLKAGKMDIIKFYFKELKGNKTVYIIVIALGYVLFSWLMTKCTGVFLKSVESNSLKAILSTILVFMLYPVIVLIMYFINKIKKR